MLRFVLLVVAMLALAASSPMAHASDAYYTNPEHPSRHYDCARTGAVVAYENSDVIFLCGGLDVRTEKHFLRGDVVHWQVRDASKLLVKLPGAIPVDKQAEAQVFIDQLALAQLTEPFYDSAEKRQVRFLGAGLALDLLGTAAGLGGGVCSEVGPVASHVPVLSVLISGGYFLHARHSAKRTPRFFTTSSQFAPYVIGAEHTVAGLHNLLTCT